MEPQIQTITIQRHSYLDNDKIFWYYIIDTYIIQRNSGDFSTEPL